MIEFKIEHQLKNFLLSLEARSETMVTGISGPSGSGKSSLFLCLSGLMKPAQAFIRINDTLLQDSGTKVFVKPHRRRIGLVFQDTRLFPHKRVLGNLKYALKLAPESERSMTIHQVANWMQITHLLDRRPRHLSGGEQQRVAITRALLAHPRLLLMDEPFSAMDEALKDQLMSSIETIAENTQIPMMIISHDLQDLSRLCSSIMSIKQGRIHSVSKVKPQTSSTLRLSFERQDPKSILATLP